MCGPADPDPECFGFVDLVVRPDGAVLVLTGEIETEVVARFQDRQPLPLPVDGIDAAAVTFIGVAGVRLIINWGRASACAGRRATLRRSARCLDRVLSLTGLQGELART